ncbi:MAG: SOS response-associated peptidase [Stellaceae bacterium]
MCNLYALRKSQDEIRRFTRAIHDRLGNLPVMPSVFPDQEAPVARIGADGERELVKLRWGMPTPEQHRRGPIDPGVTNIRNPDAAHWRQWLAPENRCIVPATSFCEPTDRPDPVTGKKIWTWFARDETRPLFAFAGLWCRWTGTRGTQKNPVAGEHELFAFLTTTPNDTVRPVHAKAMPVMLLSPEAIEMWLTAPAERALRLQRPLPADYLRVVATGEKEDSV